jgi:hypothetical protein
MSPSEGPKGRQRADPQAAGPGHARADEFEDLVIVPIFSR